MSKSSKAEFITLEGIEGAGKSTAVHFISQYLTQKNIPHITTREPGGTLIAERIRQVLLAHDDEIMAKDTELLLMFAARAQHISSVILPALQSGKWVLCDRFTDASYAYQGGGREIPLQRIETLEQWVQGDLRPDLTIVLDISVKSGLERIHKRGASDRIEKEKIEFFERVRQVYLKRAHANPSRFRIINSEKNREPIEKELIEIINELI